MGGEPGRHEGSSSGAPRGPGRSRVRPVAALGAAAVLAGAAAILVAVLAAGPAGAQECGLRLQGAVSLSATLDRDAGELTLAPPADFAGVLSSSAPVVLEATAEPGETYALRGTFTLSDGDGVDHVWEVERGSLIVGDTPSSGSFALDARLRPPSSGPTAGATGQLHARTDVSVVEPDAPLQLALVGTTSGEVRCAATGADGSGGGTSGAETPPAGATGEPVTPDSLAHTGADAWLVWVAALAAAAGGWAVAWGSLQVRHPRRYRRHRSA